MELNSIWMEKDSKSRTFILKSVNKEGWCRLEPFMQQGMDQKHDAIIVHVNTLPVWLTCLHTGREAQLLRMNGSITRSGGTSP